MNYYGLFIELPKKLEALIYREKKKIKELSINEFVNHPPHITLATFSNPYKEVLDEISFTPTPIVITNKNYFVDDNSNLTLYYNVKSNPSLVDLHYQIINNLNKKNINILYPYIKSEWKAHITIGQIKNKGYALKFSNENPKIETIVDVLSYIKYENNKHLNLKKKKYC